ncbi:MAG: DUF6785 family protein [Thermofilaceae archaeon]
MGTETKSEVKTALKPSLWAGLAVFSLVMSLIGVLTAPFGPSWMFSMVIGTFTAPIVVLFIFLLLSRVTGISASPQTLALLYAAASMSIAFCYSMIPYGIIHNAAALRMNQYNWHPTNWAVPNYWVFGPIVSDPAEMTPITTGGPVPLDKWTPFLTWWITYTILWLLFFTGWIGLLYDRWIEVERLPYPASLTGTMQIELISSKGKDPRIKYFMLGVLLGAITIIPIIATYLNPAIPDIYGWTREPFLPWFLGTMDFSRSPLGAAIPVIAFLPVNPMIYSLFYLMPTKTLFTIWAFSLFGIMIPSQIAFYMGYYSDLPTMANRFHAFMNGAPFRWNGWWIGVYFGLFLIWFALNIRYMRDIFMRDAPERALPGKLGTVMIIGSTAALIAMLIVAGANPIGAPLIVLTMWLLFMSSARVLGNASLVGTAWGFPIDWTHLPSLVKYLYIPDPGYITAPDGSQVRPPEMVATLWLANRWTGELMAENNTNFGMAFAIPLCYKVGFDTKTHPRDITKVILTSGIISAVVGYTVGLWFSYAAGTNNTRMGMFDAWWHWVFGAPWSKVEEQFIAEPLLPYIAAGFILILLISFLNFRFVWWPLDPVGVAMAFGASGTGWIIPAFVAWIVKRLIYRIGGAKLDESTVTPIVVGFLVGYWVMVFIGGIGSMIQFFLPK